MNEKERIWNEYKDKVLTSEYKPKYHYHFDPFFSFKENFHVIKELVLPDDSNTESLNGFSFLPLLKTIAKTPRFKYSKELKEYKLATKKRPIFLTAHKDKYIYGYYSYLLNSIYQEKLSHTSFHKAPIAYRSNLDGKCNIQFSKEVFDFVRSTRNCITILTDISSFFDNIDHEILKKNWANLLGEERLPKDHFKVFKALTSYRYVGMTSYLKKYEINLDSVKPKNGSLLCLMFAEDNLSFNDKLKLLNDRDLIVKNKPDQNGILRGIPQGLSISAILSNIYLWDFDKTVNDFAESVGGLYRRYCDDIILVIPGNDFQTPIRLLRKEIVEARGMVMKESKTELAAFKEINKSKLQCTNYTIPDLSGEEVVESKGNTIQYLGFTFDGKDVLIRNSSVSRFYRKMSRRVRKTIRMAYSGKSKYKSSVLFRKQIYERYTHYGKRNFLNYVYHASSETYCNSKGEIKEGHNSKKMKKQVSRHMEILKKLVKDKNRERFLYKVEKNKKPVFKKWDK